MIRSDGGVEEGPLRVDRGMGGLGVSGTMEEQMGVVHSGSGLCKGEDENKQIEDRRELPESP